MVPTMGLTESCTGGGNCCRRMLEGSTGLGVICLMLGPPPSCCCWPGMLVAGPPTSGFAGSRASLENSLAFWKSVVC